MPTSITGTTPRPLAPQRTNEARAIPVQAQAEPPDRRTQDVLSKLGRMVDTRFGGSYRAAFDAYAQNGEVSQRQMGRIMRDAGVTDGLALSFGPGRLFNGTGDGDGFDRDRNGGVNFDEFRAGMRRMGVAVE